MNDPRSVVPESVMPKYAFLATTPLNVSDVAMNLEANRAVGVPYTDEMLENAVADLVAQADPNADTSGVEEHYPKAKIGDFDGNPAALTEMEALIAYLQMIGTLVTFSTYADRSEERRVGKRCVRRCK